MPVKQPVISDLRAAKTKKLEFCGASLLSASLNFHPNHPRPTLNNTITAMSVRRLKRNRRRLVGLGLVKVGFGGWWCPVYLAVGEGLLKFLDAFVRDLGGGQIQMRELRQPFELL